MKCPSCDCEDCHVQVITWALYVNGKFHSFNENEEIIPVNTALAVCDNCDHEFVTPPQNPPQRLARKHK